MRPSPGEEKEHRRAEVGDPAREEQGHIGSREIGRTEMGIGKIVAYMVKGHKDHDQATQEIDGIKPGLDIHTVSLHLLTQS